MRNFFVIWFVIVVLFFGSAASAADLASLTILNQTNIAEKINNWFDYYYESHGCLHFSPVDISLLAKLIPAGSQLQIMEYTDGLDKLPKNYLSLPRLAKLVSLPEDLEKHQRALRAGKTSLVAYPKLGRLVILVDGVPYAEVKTMAGPPEDLLFAWGINRGVVDWDFTVATPTDAGKFTILGNTDHYLSPTYYENTIIPFGAWIMKKKSGWAYQKNNQWYSAPEKIARDLEKPAVDRNFDYYDLVYGLDNRLTAARYAGHDFGRYVILWSRDGKQKSSEMGYAAGALCYEQEVLLRDLVQILTLPGDDDFNACIAQNQNFSFYRDLQNFISSYGQKNAAQLQPTAVAYYKLFNRWPLASSEARQIDPMLRKAFTNFSENRLPRKGLARRQELGLYYLLKTNAQSLNQQAGWYVNLKFDWEFWKNLRIKFREDFEALGIYSLENRQDLVKDWLLTRMEFKKASLPAAAQSLRVPSFNVFFNHESALSTFNQRERRAMLAKVKSLLADSSSKTSLSAALELKSVKALNNYNFGLLLNQILGDLYKSHGCLHVSPRNAYFLYEVLPVGMSINIYDYSRRPDEKTINALPYLADLINFFGDLDQLKNKLAQTQEVQATVYPSAGLWVINYKNQPFAKLEVKGGPQAKMYLLQNRADDGRPIFENHLAYPTSPGKYRIFSKIENYVSKIYHDTTALPMDATLQKFDGEWFWTPGNTAVVETIQKDLNQPEENWQYNYYDVVKNASGEVVAVKWGSHPFGRYALQTTEDGRNPFPELIHSSGDLILEERQLVADLIKILSAPYDELEKCVAFSRNFELYRACYEFVKDPKRTDLIQPKERAAYRLYHGMTLTSGEAALLPLDVIAADKVLRNRTLSPAETHCLLNAGVAAMRGGKLVLNMEKILGLQFDTYQYVVAVQKYAHHYAVLMENWKGLSVLRQALLADFNHFVVRDPVVLRNFMQELMLKRTRLEKLDNLAAVQMLVKMLED